MGQFVNFVLASCYFPLVSIIAVGRLNGRVRDGNGCDPAAMDTNTELTNQLLISYTQRFLCIWTYNL